MEELSLKINRYDPDSDRGSYYQDFSLDVGDRNIQELTVLDCLIRIKEERDGSLTFRHSCGHGSCGSCAMLINGNNRLACETHVKNLIGEEQSDIEVSPLPGFPMVKDLVVELGTLFDHDREIKPYLIGREEDGNSEETLQTPDQLERIREAMDCIMCGACTSACPTYWDNKKYLGPAAFVRAFRWQKDSREEETEKRMDILDDQSGGVWGCNKVFNCNEACPKEIDTVGVIEKLKREALGF
jgi:succinate dehydrogenase / fumarate reductase iron-sulfur subunit